MLLLCHRPDPGRRALDGEPQAGRFIARIACIGGASVDRSFAIAGPVHMATSNPASARGGFGGVARNVAENLARLGVPAALVANVGADRAGESLLADARALGIDTQACTVSDAFATSEYVAILDGHNELIVAASDMRACDAFTRDAVPALLEATAEVAWRFVDCNLAAGAIDAVIEAHRGATARLAVDAVSIAKAQRLPARLDGVAVLFLNVDEARAYLHADETDAATLGARIRARGADAAVITDGPRGTVVVDAGGATTIAASATTVLDVTGAGDALIAGTLYGLEMGESLIDAVRTGSIVACVTIASPTAVHRELTPALVREQRRRMTVRA